jgi:hypothetical protein
MDATLKKMFTLRETRDVDLAALKDPGPRHRDVQEAAGTLGNRDLSRRIKARYKAAAKARHLRKGVRLAALIGYDKNGSFPDVECVRFKVPARVRGTRGCLFE